MQVRDLWLALPGCPRVLSAARLKGTWMVGSGEGRSLSQSAGAWLPPSQNKLQDSTKNSRPTAGGTGLQPAASMPPTSRGVQIRGRASPVLSTHIRSILASTQFPSACARSVRWARGRDERPIEGCVRGAMRAPTLLGSESTTNPSPHRHWPQGMTCEAHPHLWVHAQRAGSPTVTSIRTLTGLL